MEYFDNEAVYDLEISPLMQKIIEICKENNIPMVASFAYENCEENGIGCCTTALNDFDGRKIDNFVDAINEIRKPACIVSSIMIKG